MILVAVGMPIAQHSPNRSQRAELPHWAPTLGNDVPAEVRIRVMNARLWEPVANQSIHPFPVDSMSLATAPKHLVP